MPEGDTIHRIAGRVEAALVGRRIDRAEAPAQRSPLHLNAGEIEGRVLERAEARGKHLLLYLSGERVVHSHLGMSGRWRVRDDGHAPRGRPWLLLTAGSGVAAQSGGRLLRLISATRARSDPILLALGPDPLAAGFDEAAAARRLLRWEPSEQVGAALLDQRLFAGLGNVIRIEACFQSGVSPWRRVGELERREAPAIVSAALQIMREAVRTGRRPTSIYGREGRPCPRCGAVIERRAQGDGGRVTVWCGSCQR